MSSPLLRAEVDAIIATLKPEDIVARECKHATYSTHREGAQHDHLVVKEYLITKDGQRLPRIRNVMDYERPYWVEKPHSRDYPEKIQFRHMKHLDRFKSTQIKLRQDICFRLGSGNPTNTLRQLARAGKGGGQYLYGLDPGPEVFMKYSYMAKWPEAFAPNKVTVVDCETDVFAAGDQPSKQPPILWSLVSDDEIVLYVDRQWCIEIPNFAEQVYKEYYAIIDQWLEMAKNKLRDKRKGTYPKFLDQARELPLRIEMIDGDFGITQAMVNRLHDTQPDIVTGWNVFFDAQVMVNTCQRHDRDPADILSDPRVPYEFRGVYLKEGRDRKVTDNGREMRLDPQERWNVILNTASWRMQDAMQCYWQLRKAKGKEGSYSLDAVLGRQLGLSKLKYDVEDSSVPGGTLHWHMDMQRNYKVRYGVYNIIDSLAVWVLDKKNNDLSSQISSLAGACDYSRFNSQPTINSIDKLFSVMKKRGQVICSTSDEMRSELDEHILGKDGWIVTFPSHNVTDTGLFLFEDMPDVQSSIHMFNADADVETTYPTAGIIQNVGKETTLFEPCRIEGIGPETQRLVSINVTGGRVNAIEIMQQACKMPGLDQWLELAKREMA